MTGSARVRRPGILPPRVGGAGGLLGLPEDRLAGPHLREDELGGGQPVTVEYQVDRRAPPAAQDDRGLVDDLGVLGPGALEGVAVHARGHRPRLPRFQDESALEREPEQVGQPAVGLWVARHDEDSCDAPISLGHAAAG